MHTMQQVKNININICLYMKIENEKAFFLEGGRGASNAQNTTGLWTRNAIWFIESYSTIWAYLNRLERSPGTRGWRERLQCVIKQQQISSKWITDSSYHSHRQLFILTERQQNQRINGFERMGRKTLETKQFFLLTNLHGNIRKKAKKIERNHKNEKKKVIKKRTRKR